MPSAKNAAQKRISPNRNLASDSIYLRTQAHHQPWSHRAKQHPCTGHFYIGAVIYLLTRLNLLPRFVIGVFLHISAIYLTMKLIWEKADQRQPARKPE